MNDDPERPVRDDPPRPAGETGERENEPRSPGWHPSPPPAPEELKGGAAAPPPPSEPVPPAGTGAPGKDAPGKDGDSEEPGAPEEDGGENGLRPPRGRTFGAWLSLAILGAIVASFWFRGSGPETRELSFAPEFVNLVAAGFVPQVTIMHQGTESWATGELFRPAELPAEGPDREAVEALAKRFNVAAQAAAPGGNGAAGKPAGVPFRVNLGEDEAGLERLLAARGVGWTHKFQDGRLALLLLNLFPTLLLVGVIYYIYVRQTRGDGPMGFGRSRARRVGGGGREKTTFQDVAGCEEAKEEVVEVVEYLKDPKKFGRLGGKMPHGILMAGPPGTGKTLLAKAIAGEAGVPFYSIAGSDFVEMFVGVGASRVRAMFAEAKKHAPCLVFIDEIDAVGRRRGAGIGGGHDEREQTLNALLVEMDGFGTNAGIVVIAATNRPDVLDPALLRPGRFDRQVVVDLPTMEGRLAILKVHASKVKLAEGTDLSRIARGTPGCSGADLANIVNEAALIAARAEKPGVDEDDFEAARDKVLWGKERRSRAMDDQEKRCTAFHEAGHALVAILEPEADPVHKITIIPRGMALGLTAFLPKKDKVSVTRRHLLADLAIAMGGRVAEELFLPDISTGARQDLKEATRMAHSMVCDWGLSEKLGPRTFGKNEELVFLGAEVNRTQDYSEETARLIDEEVTSLLRGAHARAKELIESHRAAMEALVAMLLEKETVDGPDAEDLVRLGRVRTPAERGEEPPPAPPPVPAAPPPAEAGPAPAKDTGETVSRDLPDYDRRG